MMFLFCPSKKKKNQALISLGLGLWLGDKMRAQGSGFHLGTRKLRKVGARSTVEPRKALWGLSCVPAPHRESFLPGPGV